MRKATKLSDGLLETLLTPNVRGTPATHSGTVVHHVLICCEPQIVVIKGDDEGEDVLSPL